METGESADGKQEEKNVGKRREEGWEEEKEFYSSYLHSPLAAK